MRHAHALILLLMMAAVGLVPQPAMAARIILSDEQDLNVSFMVQFWNATTFDAVNEAGNRLDTRSDLYIRRGRFGISGRFNPVIKYSFNFAYDNVGKDVATGATGNGQGTANRDFYLWDAFCTVALDSTWANLTIGYFRPQVGRESITSAFNVNSFTKSLANSYPRRHIVGRGPGRETGLNLGGLYHVSGWGLNYNLGVFDTNHEAIAGAGDDAVAWAPLLAGRIALTVGDPEMERYGLGYQVNYFGERNGITVAVNGTYQGRTNETVSEEYEYIGGFESNSLLGIDVLVNSGRLNFGAEYDRMTRHFSSEEFVLQLPPHMGLPAPGRLETHYSDQVWHLRAGHLIPVCGDRFIEPVLLYSRFEGAAHSPLFNGDHELLSAGLNWYLDRNRWKINLHYVWQAGEARSGYSSGEDEAGDFLGIGMQLVF